MIHFTIPQAIRDILRSMDCLGFDTCSAAAGAILTHIDYADRWDMLEENPIDLATIDMWKYNTLIN